MTFPSGIFAVDKPAGMTSHTVISVLRRLTGVHRIGHAGTLDPMATGVLPVCIGRATRAADYVADAPKQYIARLHLGVETDTEDTTGTVIATSDLRPSVGEVEAALQGFVGNILQTPPMYSAVQKDGARLYKLARAGIEVERTPRPITVYGIKIVSTDETAGDFDLCIDCSKGTYVRTLCADIGRKLGCGGVMSALRRTRCGGFSVEEAHTLDELRAMSEAGTLDLAVRSTEIAFMDLPSLEINEEGMLRLKRGAPVYASQRLGPDIEGVFRIRCGDEFLGIGQICDGLLRCDKGFFETRGEGEDQ